MLKRRVIVLLLLGLGFGAAYSSALQVAAPKAIPAEIAFLGKPSGDPLFIAADWLFAPDGSVREGVVSDVGLEMIRSFTAGSEPCHAVGLRPGMPPLIEGETAVTPYLDLDDAVSRAEAILVGTVRESRGGFTRRSPATVFALAPEIQYGALLPRVDGVVLVSLPIGTIRIGGGRAICKSDPGYPVEPAIGDRVVLLLSRSTTAGDVVTPLRPDEVLLIPAASDAPVASPRVDWRADPRLKTSAQLFALFSDKRKDRS